MQALKDNIKHQQLSMDVFPPLCVIKNVKMIEDARESSQTKRNTDEVNQRDKNKGRNRKNLRCIISIEPEHVYDEMIDAKADMDVIDDEETNTVAENLSLDKKISKTSSDSLLGTTMDYLSEKSNSHTGDDFLKKSDLVVSIEDPVDIDADTRTLPSQRTSSLLHETTITPPTLSVA
ncbi:hypothetical protein Tco_0778464 [Tanacetum coccineum]